MLTMRPHLRARMAGTKAAHIRYTLSRWTDCTRRQSANVMSANGIKGKIPAQLTRISQWLQVAVDALERGPIPGRPRAR